MAYEVRNLEAYKRPSDYAGATWEDYYVVIGQHRDSDALTRSNYACTLAALNEACKEAGREFIDHEADNDIEIVVDTRAGHWAVGWVETIYVHKLAPDNVLQCADEIIGALADYPVVDESHWSELEYTETCEAWERMSLRDRVETLRCCRRNIFAARRDEMPEDDNGALGEYLRGN